MTDHKLFEDDLSVTFEIFSSSKCLCFAKLLENDKPLANAKLFKNSNLFSAVKHSASVGYLQSVKIMADLTGVYLSTGGGQDKGYPNPGQDRGYRQTGQGVPPPPHETRRVVWRGWYASCVHALGLSCGSI